MGAESVVYGVVLEVEESAWSAVLADLDYRERHGYVRTCIDVLDPSTVGSEGLAPSSLGRTMVYYAHEPFFLRTRGYRRYCRSDCSSGRAVGSQRRLSLQIGGSTVEVGRPYRQLLAGVG